MEKELDNAEYVVSNKVLKVNIKEDKVVVDVFFVVYENIVDYQEIVLEEENNNED